jgi:hypothetical protein
MGHACHTLPLRRWLAWSSGWLTRRRERERICNGLGLSAPRTGCQGRTSSPNAPAAAQCVLQGPAVVRPQRSQVCFTACTHRLLSRARAAGDSTGVSQVSAATGWVATPCLPNGGIWCRRLVFRVYPFPVGLLCNWVQPKAAPAFAGKRGVSSPACSPRPRRYRCLARRRRSSAGCGR